MSAGVAPAAAATGAAGAGGAGGAIAIVRLAELPITGASTFGLSTLAVTLLMVGLALYRASVRLQAARALASDGGSGAGSGRGGVAS
jgi:hypothetical protein